MKRLTRIMIMFFFGVGVGIATSALYEYLVDKEFEEFLATP